MKRKKVTALLLAVFLLLGLCACGGTAAEAEDMPEESAEPEPALTDDGIELLVPDESPEPSEDVEPEPIEANIDETLLLDAADVKITATGIDYGGVFGPELLLTIENGTEQALAFQCDDVYINGCKVISGLYAEAAAGETVESVMALYSEELASYGIDTIAEITVYFDITAAGDWETYYRSDAITLRTDFPEDDAGTADPAGRVLYNDKGFKIVSLGRADEDTYWGPATLLYFENDTGKTVTFQTRDAVVGDFPVDAILSTTLRPGMRAIDDLTVDEGGLAEFGIDQLETVALKFVIFDDETGEELVTTDAVTLGF